MTKQDIEPEIKEEILNHWTKRYFQGLWTTIDIRFAMEDYELTEETAAALAKEWNPQQYSSDHLKQSLESSCAAS